uniref:Uncharacterized protein n=1 Tax=Glossina pallidipes TaxID=7398 RepID=A0A1A9ZTG3_GLOPL
MIDNDEDFLSKLPQFFHSRNETPLIYMVKIIRNSSRRACITCDERQTILSSYYVYTTAFITLIILITSLKHVHKNEFVKYNEHFIATVELNWKNHSMTNIAHFQSPSPFNQIAREAYMRNIKNLSSTNTERA